MSNSPRIAKATRPELIAAIAAYDDVTEASLMGEVMSAKGVIAGVSKDVWQCREDIRKLRTYLADRLDSPNMEGKIIFAALMAGFIIGCAFTYAIIATGVVS